MTNPDTGETATVPATVNLPRSHPFGRGRGYVLMSLRLWNLLDELTPREFKVFRGLLDRMDRDNVMRQPVAEFGDELHIAKGHLSAALTALEAKGLVWRIRGQDGRRIVGVMLNPSLVLKGTRQTDEARRRWVEVTSPTTQLRVIRTAQSATK